jgi:peptide deformylase
MPKTKSVTTSTPVLEGKNPRMPEKPFDIVSYPDPRLLKKSEPYVFKKGGQEANAELITFCYGLFKTYLDMRKKLGPSVVGLAAPQVGRNLRVFIVEGKIFVNPEITWTPREGKDRAAEGCLSLPLTQSWPVWRPYGCRLKYQDMLGETYEEKFNGMRAKIIMHEMDHLEGRLCCGENYPKEK